MKLKRKRFTIEIPFDESTFGQWLTLQGFLADILTRKKKATSISQFERERLSKVEKEKLFSFIEGLSASLHKEASPKSRTLNESSGVEPQFLHKFHDLMIKNKVKKNE